MRDAAKKHQSASAFVAAFATDSAAFAAASTAFARARITASDCFTAEREAEHHASTLAFRLHHLDADDGIMTTAESIKLFKDAARTAEWSKSDAKAHCKVAKVAARTAASLAAKAAEVAVAESLRLFNERIREESKEKQRLLESVAEPASESVTEPADDAV